MIVPHPLLAAGLHELVMVIVGAIFLLSWVLGRLRDEQRKARSQQTARPPGGTAQQQPQQPAPAAKAAAGQPVDPLRAQIEDFLKRASQAAGPPQATGPKVVAQSAPAGRKTIELLPIDDTAAPRAKKSPPPRPPKPRPPQRTPSQRPTSVAEHVAQHVVAATEQMGADAAQLGDRVKLADAQFDAQLQQRFDHELGALGNRHAERVQEQTPTAAAPSPAAQIAAMLASPEGVRQAMVVNEILRRPTDRW